MPAPRCGLALNGAEVVFRAPYTHAELKRDVIDKQIEQMVERDIWRRPSWGG